MIVRRSTLMDAEPIVQMFTRMVAESRVKYPPVDPVMMREVYERAMAFPSFACFIAEGPALERAGVMFAELHPLPWAPVYAARHLVLYVEPAWRRSRAAFLMIDAFKAWARAKGAVVAVISEETGIDPERVAKLYARKGFSPVSTGYAMNLEASNAG